MAAAAADCATDRLTALAHEMGNLVDGALRYVTLAQRALGEGMDAAANGDRGAAEQLESAARALSRMTLLLKDALSNRHATIASRFAEPRPLIDAVLHAIDVHRPLAASREVSLEVDFSPRLVLSEAGPIFTVLSNAIRNSIEAIGRRGRVEVIAELVRTGPGFHEVQIDVLDDGPGPPNEPARAFLLDFTTKHAGPGVGLSLSKAIVDEMGGEISLGPREDAPHGSRLRIRYREEHG